MRWGDSNALPYASQVADAYDFATGITRDPEKIVFRSLALSNSFSKPFLGSQLGVRDLLRARNITYSRKSSMTSRM